MDLGQVPALLFVMHRKCRDCARFEDSQPFIIQLMQLNEALLPLEQWGVKSLASVACDKISIVYRCERGQ